LQLCNDVKVMERDGDNLESLAGYFIDYAISTGLKPPRLDTLRDDYEDIYEVVMH
jgi:hypothetical protein